MLAYGPDTSDALERCGTLAARILGGAKPGDLPVKRPTTFELVVNLKTVKALGLSVPDSVLIEARRVIRRNRWSFAVIPRTSRGELLCVAGIDNKADVLVFSPT